MSEAIRCDRCGEFDAVSDTPPVVTSSGVGLYLKPNVTVRGQGLGDLCWACRASLQKWWDELSAESKGEP